MYYSLISRGVGLTADQLSRICVALANTPSCPVELIPQSGQESEGFLVLFGEESELYWLDMLVNGPNTSLAIHTETNWARVPLVHRWHMAQFIHRIATSILIYANQSESSPLFAFTRPGPDSQIWEIGVLDPGERIIPGIGLMRTRGNQVTIVPETQLQLIRQNMYPMCQVTEPASCWGRLPYTQHSFGVQLDSLEPNLMPPAKVKEWDHLVSLGRTNLSYDRQGNFLPFLMLKIPHRR